MPQYIRRYFFLQFHVHLNTVSLIGPDPGMCFVKSIALFFIPGNDLFQHLAVKQRITFLHACEKFIDICPSMCIQFDAGCLRTMPKDHGKIFAYLNYVHIVSTLSSKSYGYQSLLSYSTTVWPTRSIPFFSIENDEGQYDTPAEIFWATGACLFIRREVYLKAGGLDESFFAHMEEIDLCWRVKLLGYKIYTVPQSSMYHLGGATLSATEPRKTYLNFRNNLLMLYKNLPRKEGRRLLIIRRLLDTIALARYIVAGEWQHARAVWLAHIHFRRERKRYREQPLVNLLKETPEGRRNIVVDYFIRRHHTYHA